MSQVERFTIAKLRYAGGSEHYVRYVSEAHYDASLAREAALQQRLTVADQRVDELEGLLNDAASAMEMIADNTDDGDSAQICREHVKRINAAFKPAAELDDWDRSARSYHDGLAAEAEGSTCNQIREESGLPTKNPCVACNNGACIDQ